MFVRIPDNTYAGVGLAGVIVLGGYAGNGIISADRQEP